MSGDRDAASAEMSAINDTAMSTDEPDAIAQAADYRVLEDGTLERLHAYGEWGGVIEGQLDPGLVAALLADLYRRVREEREERVTQLHENWCSLGLRVNELDERIEEAESEDKDRADFAVHLEERIEALEIERTEGVEVLADRLASAEKNLADHEQEIGDNRMSLRNVSGRLVDLEYRQRDEAGEPETKGARFWHHRGREEVARDIAMRLRNAGDLHAAAIVELEYLEDEAGEGAVPAKTPSDEGKVFPTVEIEANARRLAVREISLWLRYEGWDILADRMESAHGTGVPAPGQSGPFGDRSDLVSEATRGYIRRELAREQINRLRNGPTVFSSAWDQSLADWIEREFGGE